MGAGPLHPQEVGAEGGYRQQWTCLKEKTKKVKKWVFRATYSQLQGHHYDVINSGVANPDTQYYNVLYLAFHDVASAILTVAR